jgi:primase-polymerase (primpol)-like protein
VPAELRQLPQWVAWWSVPGTGAPATLPNGKPTKSLKAQAKPHKLPINPHGGGLASTTRSATWAAFNAARAAADRWSLSGVGFVFVDSDPYTGVDIDNCRDPQTGAVAPWATEVIHALDSYTEVSPSGTGVHIIVRGQLPNGQGNQAAVHGGKVELFSRARYFTFTVERLEGTPAGIFDRQTELTALHQQLFAGRSTAKAPVTPSPTPSTGDDELIERAGQAKNGAKFQSLWSGQWKGDYPSQSEADYAL